MTHFTSRRGRAHAVWPVAAAGLLVVLLGGCFGLDPSSPGTGIEPGFVAHPLEKHLYEGINAARAHRGLGQLAANDILSQYARRHSENMAMGRLRFGHDGFKDRASSIRTYLAVLEISENVAVNKGYDDPVAAAVESFLTSPGHRGNVLGAYDMTGVGVAKSSDGRIFFTQLFADGAGRFR